MLLVFANLQNLHYSIVLPRQLFHQYLENSFSNLHILFSFTDYLKYYDIMETNVNHFKSRLSCDTRNFQLLSLI